VGCRAQPRSRSEVRRCRGERPRAALDGEQAKIIITTLQKFPFVMEHVDALENRSYAVIIDEAHPSQTGEAAKELRAVLGDDGSSETGAELGALSDEQQIEFRGPDLASGVENDGISCRFLRQNPVGGGCLTPRPTSGPESRMKSSISSTASSFLSHPPDTLAA
jgi:hypothetical protein